MTSTSSAKQKALEAYSGSIIFAEELTANEGESHAIEGLDPDKSVRDLRHRIAHAIDNPASWSTMQVIFAGEVMEDMTKSLSHYGVHKGDTVYFIRTVVEAPPPYNAEPDAPVQVARKATAPVPAPATAASSSSSAGPSVPVLKTLFFKDLDGKSLVLRDVGIDTRMSAVFRRLAEEKSMDVEWLRFIWSGKQLNGNLTVRDYGIMNESTIHIVARLRGGHDSA
ncbi:uncharacterized protein SPSK_09716 [Sporothrix schenckii 1099-18]|uniref:Ubiquitin-like domain-containing protein n=2 Tax=Sporothrix schenckii TaxID=29908 RepID=U7Q4W0_SPOS1|nr:uncharacterized protein SPSK_09716 [Sporothrix schenckii 1099-18]ERT02894.1 hypothetical protein HMPREF1624_01197 [Sporothrix schenckii ATCC 58251]KJR84755.1 hypothetical protein SPSK_09716 [Sporothrix schenckii 1099-18]